MDFCQLRTCDNNIYNFTAHLLVKTVSVLPDTRCHHSHQQQTAFLPKQQLLEERNMNKLDNNTGVGISTKAPLN